MARRRRHRQSERSQARRDRRPRGGSVKGSSHHRATDKFGYMAVAKVDVCMMQPMANIDYVRAPAKQN